MASLRRKRDVDVATLRGLQLFSTADDSELRRVAELANVLEVTEGTTLTEEDEFQGGEFFVITDGTAEVSQGGVTFITLGEGEFFGEMGALEPRKRSATVEAASDLRLLVFSRAAFDELIADAPNVTRKIVREMGRRLRALEDRVSGD
jgi:CRP/FNR family transcriptional regulator, cyclic AMP receptor protein